MAKILCRKCGTVSDDSLGGCPNCGEPVFDTYQRIVGYLVPTRSYSKDRFREFTTRKWYDYAEMLRE